MSSAAKEPDFRILFESSPGLYLVLDPDLRIVAVTDAYAGATKTRREDIVGKGIFEVFPDNPDDPQADGVRILKASLQRVLHSRTADPMPVQKYDIRKTEEEGGGFEERFWSPANSPLLAADGSVAYIIHRVEDVTEFVRLKRQDAEQTQRNEALLERTGQMEAEIYARARQVADHREQLERGVVERTTELQAANAALRDSRRAALNMMEDAVQARQRAEQALARAQALLEAAPDPVVIADHTGRIRVLNAQAEKVFGYARTELLGQPVEVLIPGHLHAAHVALRTAYLEDSPYARRMGAGRELLARRRDGSEFAVDVSLSPLATPEGTLVISTVRDVTERKQAERRIREQLEHLNLLDRITRSIGERLDLASVFQVVVRTLEDSLPVDFCCIGLHDATADALRIESVGVRSEAVAMELALAEHAVVDVDHNGLGRCMSGELVYEPDIGTAQFPFPRLLARSGLRALVLAPLRSESRVFGVLVAARRAAEAFSSVECEFLRQLSEHIALASAQAQLHGALQQAYDDLRQTQQVVMQEERLRALGQMASGIAHDINNALSPVSLYTDSLLETEPNLSPRARGYLETIQRAVEDVALTVARMREFYRKRELQIDLAPVDANQLVRQVLDLTRARWSDMPLQHGIAIQPLTELADDLPKIMGVESELREALTNLVFNAVDAMPDGGSLTLRTRRAGNGEHASVVVEVTDNGIGMDEETRQRCLEPFFTTKGERGTGLGLAMVFGTVQRHSADFEIESAPGAGTTMRLVFTVPGGVPAAPAPAAARADAQRRQRRRLIDDDPVLLKSLGDALKTDGHAIVTANGGENGIAAFRSSLDQGARFAAVITDLGMPYVDGRRVAAAVKAASPATPVIMLTGWGRRLLADGDIPPHVDRVLAKPPKLRELREALGQLCRDVMD